MRNYKILSLGFADKVEHIRKNSILADNRVTYKSEWGPLIVDFNNGTFTAPEDMNLGVVNVFYFNAITLYISSITEKIKSLDEIVRMIKPLVGLFETEKEEKTEIMVKCKCSMESRISGINAFVKNKTYRAESIFSKGITIIDEQEARHYITKDFFDIYFEGDFSDIYRTLS